MIKKLLQRLVFAALFAFLGTASAATYYESEDSCVSAARAAKAVAYQPTAKHVKFGDARIAGLEKRSLEGDACVYLGAQPGKRWVFLKQGTYVYAKGADVQLLAECQNDIYNTVYIKNEQSLAKVCKEEGCGAVTNVIPVINVTKEIKVCEAFNGKRFDPTDNVCNFEPTKAKISTVVESSVTYTVPVTTYAKSATKAEPCTNCVPQEKVTVIREEKRTDGRCFVQTNMGYRFELRANTQTGRLMAGLIDASTEQLVSGTKALFIGDVMAAKNQKGYDCDGMQAQLYVPENWKAVRTAYNLPSACELTTKTP